MARSIESAESENVGLNVGEIPLHIVIGVAASLIATGLGWFFRRQIRTAISSLDMSAGAAFAWLMVFIMLGAVIVFPLIDVKIPVVLYVLLPMMTITLLMATVWRRR